MHPLVLLAKRAVENYIRDGKIISLQNNLEKKFLEKKAGTFVTIEKEGQLRGCIGTYLPTKENIAIEIISNAITAATKDYRFGPIQKEELPYLSYTVYILNEPELVLTKEVSDPPKFFLEKLRRAGLDPKKYGIIIKTVPISYPGPERRGSAEKPANNEVMFNGYTPYKSGLLLPDLDNIDTAEQQIAIACQKGRINPQAETIIIYRFTTEKYT